MFGEPMNGSTKIMYVDNRAFNSPQRPKSALGEKHLSICWPKVLEAFAEKTIVVEKIWVS